MQCEIQRCSNSLMKRFYKRMAGWLKVSMKNTPPPHWPISSIMCGDYENRTALWVATVPGNNSSLSGCVLTVGWPALLQSDYWSLTEVSPAIVILVASVNSWISQWPASIYIQINEPTIVPHTGVSKEVRTTKRAQLTRFVIDVACTWYWIIHPFLPLSYK